MNIVLWLPRVLYKLYGFLIFVCTFLPIFPLFYLTLLRRSWHRYTFILKRWHSLILITLGGIFMKIERHGELPEDTPYVICANHSSYVDIILLYRTFSDYFVFMGKREIEKVPLFGKFFSMGMDISVDRTSKTDAHKAFLRACEEIDKGNNVVIFPEATIPPKAPKLSNFKNGAFKLAIEKQIPIVPVTYPDNWKLLQGSVLLKGKAGPGIARAIIHPYIPTKGMTDSDVSRLKEQTYQTINQALNYAG